jgi:cysteine desulfurase
MHYLDHAATTPMLPEAIAAVAAEMVHVGNASSLHTAGRRARRVVEESRESIAEDLRVRPGDVIFTAGATEANNLLVKGLFAARREADPRRTRVITTAIEHHALIDPVRTLIDQGAEVVELPVDPAGRIDVEDVRAAIEVEPSSVAYLSVMWANNEVGTIQPIEEIAAVAREHAIPMHSDAVQAVGHLELDLSRVGLGALSLSAHKFGGPGGVGALILDRDLAVSPLIDGGGQERSVRSGTLNVAGIAGMAAALRAASASRESRSGEIERLRQRLVDGVLQAVPDAILNGDPTLDDKHRLPGNAHFSFPGCEGDALLLLLDAQDICCSTGSACSAGVAQPSHVLLAMGADDEVARSSLRFSLGHTSTTADVDALVDALAPAVARARAAGDAARSRR